MDVGSPKTPRSDFGFAFNDANFSDRVLRIEILSDPPGSRADPDEESLVDWAKNRKRRRDEQIENFNDTVEESEEQILSCTALDLEDGVNNENQENSAIAMIEESHDGLEISTDRAGPGAAQENETASSLDFSVVQVKMVYISSPILAAKSPFFYKLFTDGVESEQRQFTIQIHASEEEAMMDLLNFIYSNTLNGTTPTALLNVLVAADKFEVASCMRYCSQQLRNLPMSCESALLYLDLPSTISMADSVKQLTNAAKKFLAARFKDFSKFQEELLNLPLTGIEAVLSSDELQVASEDSLYDFVIKWTRRHYPKLEQRRHILSTHLLRYIRFPYMSCRKLKKFLTCKDIEPELASKLVINALFFKSTAPYRQRSLPVTEEPNSHLSRYVERSYKYRPIKVVAFDSPRQQCIVYLDLKRDECQQLYPSGRVYSQAFELGGQGFFLSGHCNVDQQGPLHCFGLFLGMQEKGGSVGFTVEYEFAARVKPSKDFVMKYKGNYKFVGGKAVGYRNFFVVPWSVFVDTDSPFFIDGVLHLRAELTIKE